MARRAVSPVIGVLLIVSIVVILSSVIGVYTLGLTDDLGNPAPSVSFDYEWEESSRTLTITHRAGDAVRETNTDRLEVYIHDDDETGQNDFHEARADWANESANTFPVTAGDQFVITGESGSWDLDVEQIGSNVANPGSEIHEPEVDDTVRIVWHGPGNRTHVLDEYVITSGEDNT